MPDDALIVRDTLEGDCAALLPWIQRRLNVIDLKLALRHGTADQQACYARLWMTNNNTRLRDVLPAGYTFYDDGWVMGDVVWKGPWIELPKVCAAARNC